MHKLSLLLLAGAAAASEFHDIAKQVNAANAGWRAEAPMRFNTTEEVARVCGTYLKGHPLYKEDPDAVNSTLEPLLGLPVSFDARTAFPKCLVIAHVRDQSDCGSCWAFGSTETYEGRRCVHTGENIAFSTEDTMSCCTSWSCNGCNGGQPDLALQWMSKTGVVTGGDYGDKDGCQAYAFPPCAHHVPATAKYPKCDPNKEYPTPSCKKQCQSGYPTPYAKDKHTGGKVTNLRGIEQIKTALQKGPLSAGFAVYADFPTYHSGVYKHTSGRLLGLHAVSIVGYGTADGTDYWLVKNSWNEGWGDHGFFKIAHGECGIEDSVTAIDF